MKEQEINKSTNYDISQLDKLLTFYVFVGVIIHGFL